MRGIEVEGVGFVRALNCYQINRLKRARGSVRSIAPYALAVGLTYQQYRKLPIESSTRSSSPCTSSRSRRTGDRSLVLEGGF